MLFGVAMVSALTVAAPAIAQPVTTSSGDTITATGTGQTRVTPKNRNSNASIAAAYDRARKASISRALKEAHEYAVDYANAVGLKLAGVISVTDAQANGFFAYGPGVIGPFGPGRFCGTVQQVVGKRVPGQRPTFKRVHRCVVPQFAFISLTVTYSAG
jgi:uncharacterized protein YggE